MEEYGMDPLHHKAKILKAIIILGTSGKDGDTDRIANHLKGVSNWDLISLNHYSFSFYDYSNKNRDDDFIQLMKSIIEYDTLIFATPVYWYAMSGIMKVFFDRFTDLLTIEKEIGRKLRGKNMAVISSSGGDNLGEYFWLPFKEIAKYLGMNYITGIHTVNNKDEEKHLGDFVNYVNANSI